MLFVTAVVLLRRSLVKLGCIEALRRMFDAKHVVGTQVSTVVMLCVGLPKAI